MADLLKGAPVAKAITQDLVLRAEKLQVHNITPKLAIIRVGDKPDDIAYEKGAVSRCAKAGIAVTVIDLPASISEIALLGTVRQLNRDSDIHGVLLLRPLPKHINEDTICQSLDPKKDIDGITIGSLGGLFSGMGGGYPPCTAQACIEILEHYGYSLRGKNAVVLGRSNVIGKPVAVLMLGKDATVTICHTKTADVPAVCRSADVLVAAVGRAGTVTASHVREGQIVLDVGINVDADGNLLGDVDFASVEGIVAAITPVPAGVGTVTTAVLAKHVIEAAERVLETLY